MLPETDPQVPIPFRETHPPPRLKFQYDGNQIFLSKKRQRLEKITALDSMSFTPCVE